MLRGKNQTTSGVANLGYAPVNPIARANSHSIESAEPREVDIIDVERGILL
jgi:hypothetical protein